MESDFGDVIRSLRARTRAFEKEDHQLLGEYETSTSRIISVAETWRKLEGLSLLQKQLFGDSLRCVERGIYRAAHVMAWTGFMDYLEYRMADDGFKNLHLIRPKWKAYATIEDLRENVVEHQLIEAARDLGLLSKTATKILLGLLSKRNECAHPSGYDPGLNESLGFVSELLSRIEIVQTKTL
jgi:hypothetical protein